MTRLTCLLILPLSLLAMQAAAAQTLVYRNSASLGTAGPPSDLSGLTWLGGNDWRAISDKNNAAPRLSITLNPADGSITAASIAATDVLGPPANDYEGIAYDPARHSYFVSEEATPAVHEYTTAFSQVLAFPAPTGFAGNTRSNRGLESLSLNQAGSRLYTANEEALTIDGPAATPTNPTDVRIVEYSITGNTPGTGISELHQFVYQVDAVQGTNSSPSLPAPQSGLSDMAVLPDGKLLMLERSVYYTTLAGFTIPNFQSRIYLVDLSSATPLADPAKSITDPANASATLPVAKTLLYKGNLFNMEGLAIGPATTHGLSVLGITDNQLAQTGGLIVDQVYAFEYVVPEPTGGMMLIPLGMAFFFRKSRCRKIGRD